MTILQIEHKVPNYEGWKKAFDSDPINRKKSGVRRFQISRLTDDPNYVIVDLYFDDMESTHRALAALKILWGKLEGSIMLVPQTRILDVVETAEC